MIFNSLKYILLLQCIILFSYSIAKDKIKEKDLNNNNNQLKPFEIKCGRYIIVSRVDGSGYNKPLGFQKGTIAAIPGNNFVPILVIKSQLEAENKDNAVIWNIEKVYKNNNNKNINNKNKENEINEDDYAFYLSHEEKRNDKTKKLYVGKSILTWPYIQVKNNTTEKQSFIAYKDTNSSNIYIKFLGGSHSNEYITTKGWNIPRVRGESSKNKTPWRLKKIEDPVVTETPSVVTTAPATSVPATTAPVITPAKV